MAFDHFLTLFLALAYFPYLCRSSLLLPETKETPAHDEPAGFDRVVSPTVFAALEELARIVDVSYCVGSTGIQKPFECLSHCDELRGFELIASWNTGPLLSDSCGYVALSHPPSPKRIVVAFRGTYSVANTIVDLSAYPQVYVPYDVEDGPGGEQPARCRNCTVHAGFMTSWRNTRATVLRHVAAAREQFPGYKLVLVGHSLGGAVAALAGLEMRLRGWDPHVTTFGEPKVGNGDFVRFLDATFGFLDADPGSDDRRWRFRRVTHVHDPVPLLPLAEWGYEMHSGEIFISKVRLSPSASDVSLCKGRNDSRCISGSRDAQEFALREVRSLLTDSRRPPDWTNPPVAPPSFHEQQQSPLHWPWDRIPVRYRLWELFFAHRDYFWRLGLCVPGGDPTGKE
ncbi:extracellular triacylglycerol lipase [Aspergillus steynii IBT 23096]|uniref:feruloyl esterase n=1 Tax=Aspergillus steynii IBT 23096 TaxID=1392250 RepID=A0A2I2G272_9EURO|nr:extracellular triacylglycerol lipase [Aspergillus steynii IBT 23096]PLB46980.1 extracellular triacylglycerol lipase [Aspergillus steynii IBT 23096]